MSPSGPPTEASVTLSGLVACDVCDELHEPLGPLLIQSLRSSPATGMGFSPRSIFLNIHIYFFIDFIEGER